MWGRFEYQNLQEFFHNSHRDTEFQAVCCFWSHSRIDEHKLYDRHAYFLHRFEAKIFHLHWFLYSNIGNLALHLQFPKVFFFLFQLLRHLKAIKLLQTIFTCQLQYSFAYHMFHRDLLHKTHFITNWSVFLAKFAIFI